jgi:hypothetical protein
MTFNPAIMGILFVTASLWIIVSYKLCRLRWERLVDGYAGQLRC